MSKEDLQALELAPPAFEGTEPNDSPTATWTEWADAMALAPPGYEAAISKPTQDAAAA